MQATDIVEWLKSKAVRIVHYTVGTKHISTTEQYYAQNLRELKDLLDKYYLLK